VCPDAGGDAGVSSMIRACGCWMVDMSFFLFFLYDRPSGNASVQFHCIFSAPSPSNAAKLYFRLSPTPVVVVSLCLLFQHLKKYALRSRQFKKNV